MEGEKGGTVRMGRSVYKGEGMKGKREGKGRGRSRGKEEGSCA